MNSGGGNRRKTPEIFEYEDDDEERTLQHSPASLVSDLLGGSGLVAEPENHLAEFVLSIRQQQQQQQQQQQYDSANSNSSVSPAVSLKYQPQYQQQQYQQQPQYQQQQHQQQHQQQQQPPPPPPFPCLSCMMRALQSSGLLNSCWSAAFAELEEAFAIKRVADAMTGDGVGGSAPMRTAAGAVQGRQPQQQQQQQQQRQQPIRHGSPPEPTKWHALESLCALRADLGACQHRT